MSHHTIIRRQELCDILNLNPGKYYTNLRINIAAASAQKRYSQEFYQNIVLEYSNMQADVTSGTLTEAQAKTAQTRFIKNTTKNLSKTFLASHKINAAKRFLQKGKWDNLDTALLDTRVLQNYDADQDQMLLEECKRFLQFNPRSTFRFTSYNKLALREIWQGVKLLQEKDANKKQENKLFASDEFEQIKSQLSWSHLLMGSLYMSAYSSDLRTIPQGLWDTFKVVKDVKGTGQAASLLVASSIASLILVPLHMVFRAITKAFSLCTDLLAIAARLVVGALMLATFAAIVAVLSAVVIAAGAIIAALNVVGGLIHLVSFGKLSPYESFGEALESFGYGLMVTLGGVGIAAVDGLFVGLAAASSIITNALCSILRIVDYPLDVLFGAKPFSEGYENLFSQNHGYQELLHDPQQNFDWDPVTKADDVKDTSAGNVSDNNSDSGDLVVNRAADASSDSSTGDEAKPLLGDTSGNDADYDGDQSAHTMSLT